MTNILGLAVVVKVHLCDNSLDCLVMVAVHAGLDILPHHRHDAADPRSDSEIAINTVLAYVGARCLQPGRQNLSMCVPPPYHVFGTEEQMR